MRSNPNQSNFIIFLLLFLCTGVLSKSCGSDQFQCQCGTPECIPRRLVGNKIADCADSSDELPQQSHSVCPDGLPSRDSSIENFVTEFCVNSTHKCSIASGEVCIVFNGKQHCLCKYGYFRAPETLRCVPNSLLPHFLNSEDTNCTRLLDDLNKAFPTLFRRVDTPSRKKPKARGVKTSPSIDDANGILNAYETAISLDECNPKVKNSCSGRGEVCDETANGGYACRCETGRNLINGKCVENVNECLSGNDCDPNAICIDNEVGYECLCRAGYIDTSPTPSLRPGLKCSKLVNECRVPFLNDCDKGAACIDKPIGFSCKCLPNFRDISPEGAKRPGRKCQQIVDNCKNIKCAQNAKCESTINGYKCLCQDGYIDTSPDLINAPGQSCSLLSTDCDAEKCNPATSQCILTDNGTSCQCRHGFVDLDLSKPGSKCIVSKSANPCNDYSLQDCDQNAECFSDQPGFFNCRCPKGFVDVSPDQRRHPGRKCSKLVDECRLGQHECHINAECIDTPTSYSCRCKPGFQDISIDKQNAPGRSCRRSNQCLNSDCATEAECTESPEGPVCVCMSGFVDVSRQHGRPVGRVCRPIINECTSGKHDCSSNASCIDTAESYSCRCKDGFRDDSANVRDRPGRVCTKVNSPPAPECFVNDPMSCDKTKLEVCLFRNGMYKCSCPNGYERLADGRCLVINECLDARLHNCSPDAECIDLAESFTCRCRSGFADVSPNNQPGRICKQQVNECNAPKKYNVDCHQNAICVDTPESYGCKCLPGFADVSETFNQLPGRRCVQAVNECLENNDCDKENSICEDTRESYICHCKPGFIDASSNVTHYPGRVCRKPTKITIDEQHSDTSLSLDSCTVGHSKCRNNEVCTDKRVKGEFVCDCDDNSFRFSDGTCRLFAACEQLNSCDKNAVCINAFDRFECQCKPGYYDNSPDPELSPGRQCKELVNECARTELNTCHPFARCIDATDGYLCSCLDGFVDTSSQFNLPPGRKCTNASNECAMKSLNTCDDNADCVDLADGYTCKCIGGFVDVSSSANLPPGRVCVVQTSCPKQKTDLMFLIDGSGSIGSFVFKHEILRFVREFVELFEIGHDKTRVGLIQYSDQIRHEFDLNQYVDKESLLQAITQTQYLTGLTRTGAAIQHMVLEGFSERRGARPVSNDVSRVAIVITDGRSQDNVTEPSKAARQLKVNMFAIGVTDHVLASELESIAGSPSRWFYVDRFKDLDTRLRSLIQKAACPSPQREDRLQGRCNSQTQTGCDRSLNEICSEVGKGQTKCQCAPGFERHPLTRVCGGEQCNPQVLTTCPNPEMCEKTHFGNFRCVCPANFAREQRNGICISTKEGTELTQHKSPPNVDFNHDDGCATGAIQCGMNEECTSDGNGHSCSCASGFERNRYSNTCVLPGSCDPKATVSCDLRKNERCLLHPSGRYHTCQCSTAEKRHPVTDICLKNECLLGTHNCGQNAKCIDVDDGVGFLCACPTGFLDRSPDLIHNPGRLCIAEQNECTNGGHNCSPDAICVDTPESFVCKCKQGYVDYSPTPHTGLVCKKLINECSRPELNTCSPDALCVDTTDSYVCICKAGFADLDELRNPGRRCEKIQRNEHCQAGKNTCDKNARCVASGDDDYSCVCPPDFKDKSPNPNQPGRLCIPKISECSNPSLNDCDAPDRTICTETDDGFNCRCRQGFLDISPSQNRPGRLCKKLENECVTGRHDCAAVGGICEDLSDGYSCRCAANYLDVSINRNSQPGRKCKKLVDECATGQNDCAREAICTDTEDSFECMCPAQNYIDVSPDTVHRPGRKCLRLVNECLTDRHQCSPNADCQDTPEGYTCKCQSEFEDESPNPKEQGRICRPKLVDECRLGKHDCSPNAICQDLSAGFACVCKQEFIDANPSKPGRMCISRPTPKPDNCRQNDCHAAADCINQPNGFTCRCRQGYKDFMPQTPGKDCRPLIDECKLGLNDCAPGAAVCQDLDEGFSCKCNAGFKDMNPQSPGRICKRLVNECENPNLNSCDKNAICQDLEDGYTCRCKNQFLDVSPSPSLPGRACRPIVNECLDKNLNDCDRIAICTDTVSSFTCECPAGSRDISPNAAFPGRVCQAFSTACKEHRSDCDPAAICQDNEESFVCSCPPGFIDRSPNKQRLGRVCVKLVDECRENRHTCSQNAICRDLEDGYTCECKEGFLDKSPSQPGRVCTTPEICPPNHECSSAAICEPLSANQYRCSCIQGYTDQSPDPVQKPGRICVRNNACHDPRLNECSRNAICYSEASGGYRCECRRGYIDRSVGGKMGRVCEPPAPAQLPPRSPCQDQNLNDCHAAATCRALGQQSYSCECLPGYEDKSTDRNKPGRMCVLTEPACLSPEKNDCHAAAICLEQQGGNGFTCRCRDGFTDQSPDVRSRPGRICTPTQNPCLDRSLNDCDAIAVCENHGNSYTCRCPANSIDQSPDVRSRPGRKCLATINECINPSLNNCSRFADCFDEIHGYRCHCRDGYVDNNPKFPGTVCTYKINECESPNLNDCHQNAECIDTERSYDCKCKAGHQDVSPDPRLPGRLCRLNECKNPSLNKCSKDANCIDTDDFYTCVCKEGFFDESPNLLEPGRKCTSIGNTGLNIDDVPNQVPGHKVESQVKGMPCGRNNYCNIELGEVCVSGVFCSCRPGEGRSELNRKCQPIDQTPLTFRVVARGQQPLFYSSEYGNDKNEGYIEFAKEFDRDLGRAVGGTEYTARYVNTDISYITHPKTVNSSWDDGLLVNYKVGTVPAKTPIDACDLWDQLMESLQRSNGLIGGGRLQVASDVDLLDPCAKPEEHGEHCGGQICNKDLGESCIGGQVCGCTNGEKRSNSKDSCHPVESWQIPLWVIRRHQQNLVFNESFSNPLDSVNKAFVQMFEDGISQCYPHTSLKNAFVSAEVNEIMNPMNVNASWDTGLLYNATMHFRRGAVHTPSDAYNSLIRYIINQNNYQVGESGLYLNPYQPNPFSACFKNNCHPKGVCMEQGSGHFSCKCAAGYRDLNPMNPGQKCLPITGFNECERPEDNECSEHARCIDLDHLYKCECGPGFSDAAPKGKTPGSICVLDYCSDVSYCPKNSTCVNGEQSADCICNHGYVDIRHSENRVNMGLSMDNFCLNIRDVDECALGLTNCSGVAICTDNVAGYSCKCPDGYIDGNPAEPGRVCGALLCDLCNSHGDCVHSPLMKNITCQCTEGYTGEFCELAPSNAPLILLILLALLFLLLTLCCLLYLCTKCRCFKRYREPFMAYRNGIFPWATLDHSTSSESGADFSAMSAAGDMYNHELGIPRAKLKSSSSSRNMMDSNAEMQAAHLTNYLDEGMRIPRPHLNDTSSLGSGSSEYTIREEIERRVITDITMTETKTTTEDIDEHELEKSSSAEYESEFQTYRGGENEVVQSETVTKTGASSSNANAQTFGSHAQSSSSHVNMRDRLGVDEEDRAESIAEFSNKEWHSTYKAGDYKRGQL